MRVLIAATIIALLIQPASAQLKPTFKIGEEKDPAVEQYRKQQEEEYKGTLSKIPDKEKKSKDPWRDLRGDGPAKKKAN
jgi:hypothetical protein